MNTALNIFNAIWPLIALGGGATAITQLLKRLTKLENNAVIRFLFHSVTVVITASTYLLGNHALSLAVLAVHGGAISGFAAALYPFVKWLDKWAAKINAAIKVVDQGLPAIQQTVDGTASSTGTITIPHTNVTSTSTAKTTGAPAIPAPADF